MGILKIMNLYKYIFLVHSRKSLFWLNQLNNISYAEKCFHKTVFKKGYKKVNGKLTATYSFFPKEKEHLKCYNCQSDMKFDVISFVCKNCKALVDVEVFKRFNNFELFSLNVDYDLDKIILKQKFNDVQKLFHPDKHSQSAELEKINEASSYLNNAYKLLNSDMERAIYLLELLFNYKINDNENIEDDDFLQEIIKINEQIDSSEDIKSLTKQYEKEYQNHIDELKLYFKEKNCDHIVKVVKKMKFIDKILERIKNM